jgi:glycosyltransferase involved in cell wall biosynthesis
MKTTPVITVVIPVYNVEKYLVQCLDSVIAQNFKDFEVICVDDVSEDGSIQILAEYLNMDSRFKLISHKENLGLPGARNSGIDASNGDYLFFLDSDDWIAPHTFSLLYDLCRQDKADIAMGGVLKCEDETGRCYPGNHSVYMTDEFHSATVFDNPVINSAVISCNKLVRSDFIAKKNLKFSPEPRRFEDMLTYKWYFSGAQVSHKPDITYFYRQRSSQTSNGSIMQSLDNLVMRDRLLAIADISAFMVENGHFYSKINPIDVTRALSWMLPDICRRFHKEDVSSEHVIDTFLAFKKLCMVLPETYRRTLPRKLKKAYDAIVSENFNAAVRQVKKIYTDKET